MKKTIFLSFAILALGTGLVLINVHTYGQISFQNTIGYIAQELATGVDQTTDGGYIVCGQKNYTGLSGYDIFLVKIDRNGERVWSREYDMGDDEYSGSVIQTSDGGYMIVGKRVVVWGNDDGYVIKTDSIGNVLWSLTIGGSNDDNANSVVQIPDGSYVIAGETENFGAGWFDMYLLKLDSSGGVIWDRTYGGTGLEFGNSVDQASDGGFVIVGRTTSFGVGDQDVYLVKTNSTGIPEWSKTYGSSTRDYGLAVRQTSDGGYIIAGATIENVGLEGGCLIKTNATGDTLWARTYYGTGAEHFASVSQTLDGGYIAMGTTNSFGNAGNNLYVVKTDSEGNLEWDKAFGGDGSENSSIRDRCILQSEEDGGYVLCGSTSSTFSFWNDMYIIKTNSEGASGCFESDANSTVGHFQVGASSGLILNSGIFVTSQPVVTRDSAVVDTIRCSQCWLPEASFNSLIIMYTVNLIDSSNNAPFNWFWDFGDGNTDTGQNTTHTYDTGGIYTVCLTVTNECGVDTICDTINIIALSIQANEQDLDWELYPNPFSYTTTLQTSKILKGAALTIYNLYGQQVNQIKNISGQTITLHRDNLPSGLYFIRLTQDNKVITTDKLVIMD